MYFSKSALIHRSYTNQTQIKHKSAPIVGEEKHSPEKLTRRTSRRRGEAFAGEANPQNQSPKKLTHQTNRRTRGDSDEIEEKFGNLTLRVLFSIIRNLNFAILTVSSQF